MNALRSKVHFKLLADLTRLPVGDLYMLTVHRFSEIFNASTEYRGGLDNDVDLPLWIHYKRSEYIRSSSSAAICPYCINESNALLLPWLLRHVTVCPVHQVLLIDRCSSCKTVLYEELKGRYCQNCGKLWKNMVSFSIAHHPASLQLTEFLWEMTGCKSAKDRDYSHWIPENHPLKNESPSIIFRFLEKVSSFILYYDPLSPLFSEESVLNKPDVEQLLSKELPSEESMLIWHIQLLGMWRLLRKWPDSWYMTIEHVAEFEGIGKTTEPSKFPPLSIEVNFPTLFVEILGRYWLGLYQSWQVFMQMMIPINAVVWPWLSNYGEKQWEEWLQASVQISGFQADYRETSSQQNNSQILQKEAVSDINQISTIRRRTWRLSAVDSGALLSIRRGQQLTLEQTASCLGINSDQVAALVAAGLLQAEMSPLVSGGSDWNFVAIQLERFMYQLLVDLPIKRPRIFPSYYCSYFAHLQYLIQWVGVSLPRLLIDIRDKVLPTYRVNNEMQLTLLWFDKDDVITYLRIKRDIGATLLPANSVCEQLGCSPTALRHLYASARLMPIIDETIEGEVRHQYDQQAVSKFQSQYITSKQAADLLGVTELTVQRWVRTGKLTAVTGPDIDGSALYRFEETYLFQWRRKG